MRMIFTAGILLLSVFTTAQIPEWYKRDIASIVQNSKGVILYKVKSVSLDSSSKHSYSYIIETETIEKIKGKAPRGNCYFIYTEEEWENPPNVGEKGIVILHTDYTSKCGVIDPGFGAPGTNEYVSLFKYIVKSGT